VDEASEIQDRSLLQEDRKICDLTGLLGSHGVGGDQRDMSRLNDVTNLNDATGLERLSSGEVSSQYITNPDQDLDNSASKSNDSPQAQLEL